MNFVHAKVVFAVANVEGGERGEGEEGELDSQNEKCTKSVKVAQSAKRKYCEGKWSRAICRDLQ